MITPLDAFKEHVALPCWETESNQSREGHSKMITMNERQLSEMLWPSLSCSNGKWFSSRVTKDCFFFYHATSLQQPLLPVATREQRWIGEINSEWWKDPNQRAPWNSSAFFFWEKIIPCLLTCCVDVCACVRVCAFKGGGRLYVQCCMYGTSNICVGRNTWHCRAL